MERAGVESNGVRVAGERVAEGASSSMCFERSFK